MTSNKDKILLRYTGFIFIMGILVITVIVKAIIIMFAEKGYWMEVADRYVSETKKIPPTREISSRRTGS